MRLRSGAPLQVVWGCAHFRAWWCRRRLGGLGRLVWEVNSGCHSPSSWGHRRHGVGKLLEKDLLGVSSFTGSEGPLRRALQSPTLGRSDGWRLGRKRQVSLSRAGDAEPGLNTPLPGTHTRQGFSVMWPRPAAKSAVSRQAQDETQGFSAPGLNWHFKHPFFHLQAGLELEHTSPPPAPPGLALTGGGTGRPLLPQGPSSVPTRAAPGPSSRGCPSLPDSLSSAALPFPALPCHLPAGKTFLRPPAFSC